VTDIFESGAILDFVETVMSSPWIYPLIIGLAALDAFFPVVPSESVVITAGVFAASGEPNLLLVMLMAAAGALAGDHISYQIGRSGGGRLLGKLTGGKRIGESGGRVSRLLERRGGQILVVARYIPGGRTATTLTMGAVGYPRRSFFGYDLLAATSWALYSALIGYIGGASFEDDPLRGLLFGLGFALAVSAAVEVVRFVRKRMRRRSKPSGGPSGPGAPPSGSPHPPVAPSQGGPRAQRAE
jgi:membrane protein DedA with SNARE-associated domain